MWVGVQSHEPAWMEKNPWRQSSAGAMTLEAGSPGSDKLCLHSYANMRSHCPSLSQCHSSTRTLPQASGVDVKVSVKRHGRSLTHDSNLGTHLPATCPPGAPW